jgi:hypothetical protein
VFFPAPGGPVIIRTRDVCSIKIPVCAYSFIILEPNLAGDA